MKVSFLGAGAIGAMFGALLRHSRSDLQVQLIVRGDFGESLIRNQAVEILGPWGSQHVSLQCSSDYKAIEGSDFVFVTVKSQDTESILQNSQPYFGNALIVSIQNGINDDTYSKFLSPESLVMGMTTTNMVIVKPGQVSMQLDGFTLFGAPHGGGSNKASQQVANLFQKIHVPGLHFAAHENILGIRYNKLAINALGYASCLSRSNFINEAIGCARWRKHVGNPIIRECRQVLHQAHIEIERMPGRSDLSRVERLMHAMDVPVLGTLLRRSIRSRFEKKPIVFSLLQDLLRGKPTEVDSINGQFVKLANQTGSHAPINRTIVAVTHELERSQGNRFTTREELIRRVQEATSSI